PSARAAAKRILDRSNDEDAVAHLIGELLAELERHATGND
ncbi:MAG: hypothetical protein QOH56_2219, partial [Pseudonocardiales bacterium]|nr:hypothetical protein [Pseudonocardiales bacterium]